MSARLALWSALYLFLWLSGVVFAGNSMNPSSSLKSVVSRMPTAFTTNAGQWPDSVLFRADAGGATMWFMQTGIYYQFMCRDTEYVSVGRHGAVSLSTSATVPTHRNAKAELIKAEFLGAVSSVTVVAEGELEHKSNFFLGNDPVMWRTDVSNYSCIVYKGLYPGIDLVYSGQHGTMECRMVGAPGADLSQVRVRFAGARKVQIDDNGDLLIEAAAGAIKSLRPVGVQYAMIDELTIGLSSTPIKAVEQYSSSLLGLSYATYIGGNSNDVASALAVDDSGQAYVAGFTASADFPTLNAFQGSLSTALDVFVVKLSQGGNSLVYATYIGGNDSDYCHAIVVDSGGSAYLAGATESPNFPTQSAYATGLAGGADVFVTKLSSGGNGLWYSTFLGGSGSDGATAVDIDSAGNAYIAGSTGSSNFPVQSAFQPTDPDGFVADAFVTKLSASGSSLVYSTYLGGTGYDFGHALAVDGSGAAYVTGETGSTDFPTANAFQPSHNPFVGSDAFVTKLAVTGDSLIYSTYLGGDYSDMARGIAVDGAGSAYLTGQTESPNFPTQDPYQAYQGYYDVFVTRFTADGSSLVFSTHFGGVGYDVGEALALTEFGPLFVAGWTYSTDLPVVNPYQTDQPFEDAFVIKFNAAGDSLKYSTYLGGSNVDSAVAIACDPGGSAFVAGVTASTNFPTANPYQADLPGRDAFVVRLCDDADFDCVSEEVDNCPTTYNPSQEDLNGNGVGDICDVGDTLRFILFSPVNMVVTDPANDSIGVDSASNAIFNTILNGSGYDTLSNYGGTSDLDDIVTIVNPLTGNYKVRIFREDGASDSATFTLGIRINGNQLLYPDDYYNQYVTALGSTIPDTVFWTATTTLPGDCNADGNFTSADIIYLVNYVFKGGTPPVVDGHSDVNCDGATSSADIIYMVNFVFKGGLSPCSQTAG